MSSEYCPHCRAARSVSVATTSRHETLPDGGVRPVRTRSYHCSTCRRFIRSEEVDAGRPSS